MGLKQPRVKQRAQIEVNGDGEPTKVDPIRGADVAVDPRAKKTN